MDIHLKPHEVNELPLTLVEGALVLQVAKLKGILDCVVAVLQHEIQIMEKAQQRGTLTITLRNPDEFPSDEAKSRRKRIFKKRQRKTKIEIWSEGE